MKRITFPLTIAAAFLAAACYSYKPLPHPVSAVGKTVKVQFSVPRSLVAVRGVGADSVLSGVSALQGQVVDVAGDTMNVALLRITDTALDHEVPPGMTARVVRDPSVAVDVLEIDAGKTVALAGGTLLVISTAAIVALLVVLTTVARFD